LRRLARAGLRVVDIDQENSHFRAELRRHPAAEALSRYIRQRDVCLQEVMQLGVSRDHAKQLFLQLGYGGGVATWCEDNGVDAARLPPFVEAFRREQAALREVDASREAALHQKAVAAQHPRPDVKVQQLLNCAFERHQLNLMQARVSPCRLASFEHDGLLVWCSNEDHRHALLERMRGEGLDVPAQVKEPPPLEELMAELRTRCPGDWDTVELHWKEQLEHIREARSRGNKVDLTFARVVACEAQAFSGYPWSVADVFKHDRAGSYAFFEPKARVWHNANSELGRNTLLHVIGDVLSRRMGDCKEPDGCTSQDFLGDDAWRKLQRAPPDEAFAHGPLLDRVEKLLRAPLTDPHFELDGETTRRYLAFDNTVFDAQTLTWCQNSPELRVTGGVGWSWAGSGLSRETEEEIDRALEAVKAGDADAWDRIEKLTVAVPDLDFFHSLCGSWERALYGLKHVARAAFALRYQENLVTRGPGGNGKDTLANRVAVFLGRYFVNLAAEALTQTRDSDAASPTFLALRGKRFVCIRELAANTKIRGHIYKTIADPKSKLKARALYGQDQLFHPHWLLFICTNVSLELDQQGCGGCARRTRILDLPYTFRENPTEANHRTLDPALEDKFEERNPSFFYLVCAIYRIFLRDSKANTVTPVPEEVQEATTQEISEPWMLKLAEFRSTELEPTSQAGEASTAAEVRNAFSAFSKDSPGAIEKRELSLRFSQQGFSETSKYIKNGVTHSTKRVYELAFASETGEQVNRMVKLRKPESNSR